MEELRSKLKSYQKIVQNLLQDYAKVKPAYGEMEVEIIFDNERNHYQIVHMGWKDQRWIHHCTMHLDIRNDRIWIFRNSTEHDIALDLENLGVPKQDIVLGFCPPFIREMGDYGVG
jgi:hypothetical protein